MVRRAYVITDCCDANAILRQAAAWPLLAKTDQPTTVQINGAIEGSGMLVDALVEVRGSKAVIFCQSAPRDFSCVTGGNGTNFGYFWHQKTLVLVSLGGPMLSQVIATGLLPKDAEVWQLSIPEVLAEAVRQKKLEAAEAEVIRRTQFRSLKFAPRVAGWIIEGVAIPKSRFDLSSVSKLGNRVWWVDNFGNCKTSVRLSDVPRFAEGVVVEVSFGKPVVHELVCYHDLRSVPVGQAALVVGSSGLEGDEFLELVVQGVHSGSAAKEFGLVVGSEVNITIKS